jgi:hypothetical protein
MVVHADAHAYGIGNVTANDNGPCEKSYRAITT